jgi:cell division control protein 45
MINIHIILHYLGEGEEETVVSGAEAGHIEEVPEFRFFLYRHWSLFDAMYHSSYVASKMPVWQAQGTVKLKELLAKMGVPLYQCNQNYAFMSPVLKNHFRQQILKDNVKSDYNLKNPDVTYRSFFRYNSFKNPVGASDVVYAASSLLEMFRSEDYTPSSSSSSSANANVTPGGTDNGGVVGGVIRQIAFNEAYDCLGMQADGLLKKGIQTALSLQRTIVKKAAVMMEAHDSISKLNRLYFAYVHQATSQSNVVSPDGNAAPIAEGEMDAPFSRPGVLTRLGQFIMEVKRNMTKKQGGWTGRRGLLPLILISEKRDSYLVVGISPLSTSQGARDIVKEDQDAIGKITNFRSFFKLAMKEIKAKALNESFDSNVIEIAKEDVQDFLGTLDYLLKGATRDYFN